MSDRDLVAALRAGDRLAAGQVYDIYGTRLYAYCHELLADAKLSADALRDAFIVAVNRVRELGEPEEFGAWLYALARAECMRVGISDDAPADAAGAARGDRLARLALDCYSMLEPEQRELLDLAFRHRLVDSDLALVLGADDAAVSAKIAVAQSDLETSLLVVLAARTGDPRCAEAADFGRKFDEIDGSGMPVWLQGASKHVEKCSICGDAVRNRRPLRLFEELPHAFMPPGVRSRVLEALRDPAGAAFAEQITERAGRFDEAGFPMGGKAGGGPSGMRKWILPGVGALAAAACAVALIMLMTNDHPNSAAASSSTSSVAASATASTSATSTSSFAELTGSATGSASSSPSSSAATTAQATTQQAVMTQQQTTAAAAKTTTCVTVMGSVPVKITTSVPVKVTVTYTPPPVGSDSPTPTTSVTITESPTTITSESPTSHKSCN